ncbi:MAG: hypothetical protein QNJ18_01670 [Xenococcaceae cyanobacterium MO_167.B52]|nr:hypothetical protein [Xenococcaceae cyanobacterium MO_167.B52]
MGKKAKLKKMRRELKAKSQEHTKPNTDNFIKQVEKTGYRLQNIQRSPEVPRDNVEPQL